MFLKTQLCVICLKEKRNKNLLTVSPDFRQLDDRNLKEFSFHKNLA